MEPSDTLVRVAGIRFADYRPQPLIDAVNALVPLGAAAAVAAIDAELAMHDPATEPLDGWFLLSRILFDVPRDPGFHPPPRLGGSSPPPPARLELLPRFPIVVVRDVPLLIISGYALGGDTEPVTADLDRVRRSSRIRSTLLSPSGPREAILAEFRDVYEHAYERPASGEEVDRIGRQLDGVVAVARPGDAAPST